MRRRYLWIGILGLVIFSALSCTEAQQPSSERQPRDLLAPSPFQAQPSPVGRVKGLGYFGKLQRPDGGVSTEISIGVGFDGKETEIPSLVPTLNKDEIDYLLTSKLNSDMWKSPTGKIIVGKAVEHAKKRMAEGKSPFAEEGEQYQQPSQVAEPSEPRACIIDIDGTIANERERRAIATNPDGSTNWRKYFNPELVKQDKPILKSREVLRWVEQQGIRIFYVSSRETTILEATKWWLKTHNFPEGKVYHRKPFGRSLEYKIGTVRTIQKRYDVIFGVGDRDRDITAYQTCGITAIKVKESSEEDWDRVKNEIAKLIK